MVYSGGIDIKSTCAHHGVSFFGICHIAYLPSPKGYIVGLSKLNRIADFFSKRPTVQEDLTMEIHDYVNKICKDNLGCAVLLSCSHLCCRNRGVNQNSIMKTSKMSGEFLKDKSLSRQEFYDFVKDYKP
jgi:GTP cyclohydrolase I